MQQIEHAKRTDAIMPSPNAERRLSSRHAMTPNRASPAPLTPKLETMRSALQNIWAGHCEKTGGDNTARACSETKMYRIKLMDHQITA
jgi:hypothetical protein